jgi:hypothetical protein
LHIRLVTLRQLLKNVRMDVHGCLQSRWNQHPPDGVSGLRLLPHSKLDRWHPLVSLLGDTARLLTYGSAAMSGEFAERNGEVSETSGVERALASDMALRSSTTSPTFTLMAAVTMPSRCQKAMNS